MYRFGVSSVYEPLCPVMFLTQREVLPEGEWTCVVDARIIEGLKKFVTGPRRERKPYVSDQNVVCHAVSEAGYFQGNGVACRDYSERQTRTLLVLVVLDFRLKRHRIWHECNAIRDSSRLLRRKF
jgi:hypothetical protein